MDIVVHQILPAASAYTATLCDAVIAKEKLGVSHKAETALIALLSETIDSLYEKYQALKTQLDAVPSLTEQAIAYYADTVIPSMEAMRQDADILEANTASEYWPYPSYSALLYY